MIEPHQEEELRQFLHDRKCESFPTCDNCCESLYPFEEYFCLFGKRVCPDCVRSNRHYTFDLEESH